MHDKPFLYAVMATAYIVFVSSFLYYGPRMASDIEGIIVPIAMLSLFVLSSAVMGFLFLYHPLTLYFDGQKHEAVRFFGKTVFFFAIFTALFFLIIFLLPLFL